MDASHVIQEIATQPEMWRRAADVARTESGRLPAAGERVAIVGCGTSLFMAEAYAAAREQSGQGETDAFTPSEALSRRYDVVMLLTRSGTTTEVLDYARTLAGATRAVAITGTADSPIVELVQRRRAARLRRRALGGADTLRHHRSCAAAGPSWRRRRPRLPTPPQRRWTQPLPVDPTGVRQFVFLGHGLGVGVAREAALKLREAAGAWTEAYPATEFRHGPISAIDAASVVWAFSAPPASLPEAVRATGATFLQARRDPMVELLLAQRLAVALAEKRGLDPDHPLHLTRSVILTDAEKETLS